MLRSSKESKCPPIRYPVEVGDEKINFLIDTGAEANILPWSMVKKHDLIVRKAEVQLRGFQGTVTQSLGEVTLKVKDHPTQFQVVDHGVPILGRQSCFELGLFQLENKLLKVNVNKLDAIKNVKLDFN